MSDFSLTLVLQIKTSKIINDVAKIQQKSEKITAFGGMFFVLDIFDRILSYVIDSHLGLRSTLTGYQYSEIIRAVFSVFCCGGDCMEDLNLYLKGVLTERPHTRVPSADTVLRGIDVPLRGGSNGQGHELPVPIHRRAGQVDQDGKAKCTQRLLRQAKRPHLGLRIGRTPSRDIQAAKAILGKGEIVRPSAISCKTLLLTAVMWAIHWVHVPILCIKNLLRILGLRLICDLQRWKNII